MIQYRAAYYFGNFTKNDDAAAVWRELDLHLYRLK